MQRGSVGVWARSVDVEYIKKISATMNIVVRKRNSFFKKCNLFAKEKIFVARNASASKTQGIWWDKSVYT
jgi:hypothetical protein